MNILRHETTESTNLEARRHWGANQSAPFAVVADTQHGGVGRNGRPWQSPRGGLWTTVAWPIARPMPHYQGLPLVVGLSLSQTLADFYAGALQPTIKWPNDVLLGGRKVAGILCQTDTSLRPPVILIGVGLNGNFPVKAIGEDVRFPATTLRDELPRSVPVRMEELTPVLLNRLEHDLGLYEREGLAAFHDAINGQLAWRGQEVAGTAPDGLALRGVLKGIDRDGRLLLKQGDELVPYMSAELDCLTASGN